MKTIRKPLKKSILKGIGLFMAVLCAFLTVVQYYFLRSTLYTQYRNRMANVLKYAADAVPAENLAEFIATGDDTTEKFRAAQAALDDIRERTGVQYLYVIIPLNTEKTDNIQNVIAGATREEHRRAEAGTQPLMKLNSLSGDDYSPEAARKYLDAYGKDGITYFESVTEFGDEYTGMMTLRDRETGEKIAALCVDFEVNEIRGQIRENLLDILIVVVILGLMFATMFMIWADRHIIRPVHTLEKDVAQLAVKSHTSRNPDAMVYSADGIRTGNEVESLAKAVETLSLDMRDYVKNLVDQEKELTRLSSMANRDVLTHVGNRNAYEQYAENLQLKMTEGRVEFGILTADVNRMKQFNEEHGHERGDVYLQASCRVICEVFRHSPVFRIGGDEFAVMLLGADFPNRQALADEAQAVCLRAASDEKSPPWEQPGLTFGMAVYDPLKDRTVGDVLERAERRMREAKEQGRPAAGE